MTFVCTSISILVSQLHSEANHNENEGAEMISSEYFVILWLIPVTLFIIIPLSICFCWLAVRCLKDLTGGKIPFIDFFSNQYFDANAGVQKRKEPRASIDKGLTANINDGINSFNGIVANISSMGLCIKEIPENITIASEKVSIVIRNGEEEMQVVGRLCWQYLQESRGRILGLEVTQSTDNWGEYVMSH